MFRPQNFPARWFYPLISGLVALGLVVGTPQLSSAFDLRDLIGPARDVIQLTNLSDEQEMQLGGDINEQIAKEVKFYRDRSINEYVREIGERLTPHSTRPNLDFKFQVVDDDAINAFATMGGYVYVNTGLLKAADNEAQVAGVIAHEMGHITGKHAIKQIRRQIITQGLANAAGLERNQLIQLGAEVVLRLPHSRRHEYDADRRGLENFVAAGYAPIGMVQFFQKLVRNGASLPTILSTHPDTKDRIIALEEMIQQQYPGREKVGYGLDADAYAQKVKSLKRR